MDKMLRQQAVMRRIRVIACLYNLRTCDLSRHLRINPVQYRRFERGLTVIAPKHMQAISELLDIDVEDLEYDEFILDLDLSTMVDHLIADEEERDVARGKSSE